LRGPFEGVSRGFSEVYPSKPPRKPLGTLCKTSLINDRIVLKSTDTPVGKIVGDETNPGVILIQVQGLLLYSPGFNRRRGYTLNSKQIVYIYTIRYSVTPPACIISCSERLANVLLPAISLRHYGGQFMMRPRFEEERDVTSSKFKPCVGMGLIVGSVICL
jgi:hypothetical protein